MAQMSVDTSRIGNISTLAMSAGLALASDTAATSELANAAIDVVTPSVPTERAPLTWKDYIFPAFGLTGKGESIFSSTAQGVKETFESKKEDITSLLRSAGKVAVNIGNAVLASSGTCKISGSTGTLAQFYLDQIFTLFYFNITDTDPIHYGYPLSQNKKINTLSGFILCANDGDLQIDGLAMERQAIVSAMTGGFYYE